HHRRFGVAEVRAAGAPAGAHRQADARIAQSIRTQRLVDRSAETHGHRTSERLEARRQPREMLVQAKHDAPECTQRLEARGAVEESEVIDGYGGGGARHERTVEPDERGAVRGQRATSSGAADVSTSS